MSEKKLRNITDALCFLMILGYVMYLVATWGNLPERVPIHFNVHGIPDRYGKKGSLLLEPILGLLILALLMFCQRFPQWWNYPPHLAILGEYSMAKHTFMQEVLSAADYESFVYWYAEWDAVRLNQLLRNAYDQYNTEHPDNPLPFEQFPVL